MPKTREDIIVMKEEVYQFVLRNPEHDLYKHCTTLFEKEAILLSLGWKELCPFCPRTNGFVVEYNQAEKKNFNKGKIRARDSARETAGFPPMRKKKILSTASPLAVMLRIQPNASARVLALERRVTTLEENLNRLAQQNAEFQNQRTRRQAPGKGDAELQEGKRQSKGRCSRKGRTPSHFKHTPKKHRKNTAMPDTPAKGAIAGVNLEHIVAQLANTLGDATKSNTSNIHGLIEVAKRHDEDIKRHDEDINRNTNNIAYLAEKDKQRDHEIADIKRRIGQHSDENDHMCRAQGKYNMRVSHELNQIRNKLGWEQVDLGLEDSRSGNIEDLLAESDSDFDE